MKKFLSLLGTLSVGISGVGAVVACGTTFGLHTPAQAIDELSFDIELSDDLTMGMVVDQVELRINELLNQHALFTLDFMIDGMDLGTPWEELRDTLIEAPRTITIVSTETSEKLNGSFDVNIVLPVEEETPII